MSTTTFTFDTIHALRGFMKAGSNMYRALADPGLGDGNRASLSQALAINHLAIALLLNSKHAGSVLSVDVEAEEPARG